VIVVVLVVTPITIPDEEPTVATVVVLLVQWPPVVASVNVVEAVPHTWNVPAIDAGAGTVFTDKSAVVLQPVGNLYVIVVVPLITPVTIPVEEPTVATEVVLLVQVPPGEASVSATVAPSQIAAIAPITAGIAFTVNVCFAEQPVVVKA